MRAIVPLAFIPFMGLLVVITLVITDDRALLMVGAFNPREA